MPNPLNATDQIGQQFKKAIKGFLSDSAEGGTDHAANWSTALKDPIIGTPAPRGPPNPAVGGSKIDLAFTTAVNPPWAGFIGDIYWGLSCGLALGILFIVVAFLGVRYKSIDPMVRKKLTRRVFFAFMAIFFWLPTASLAGQFFNELGFAIVNSAPPGKTAVVFLAGVFQISNTIGFEGLILIFILSMYVWIKSVLIFLGRWIGLILLTLFMPVVGVFWALEVWPLNRFSGLAKQIAGAYPGLLVAGIPPAILIRLALEGNTWGPLVFS
ncbi:hypothetical protein ACFQL1_23620 [Halomicroarcula sp. GCM10025709]|uniref:hypothetical protein n=1 Tax=Haloarcula TaxID=2237 RepID=UPI0024C46D78|nr:hypothetical protein [Halomicroarcula sp. YJ-61-S]